jgi:hypothetical protein
MSANDKSPDETPTVHKAEIAAADEERAAPAPAPTAVPEMTQPSATLARDRKGKKRASDMHSAKPKIFLSPAVLRSSMVWRRGDRMPTSAIS